MNCQMNQFYNMRVDNITNNNSYRGLKMYGYQRETWRKPSTLKTQTLMRGQY